MFCAGFYKRNMALPIRNDWHLEAWLEYYDHNQVWLQNNAGWGKRKASELVTGKQRYNRDSLNEAANALNIAPYELLMSPEQAMSIRSYRLSAMEVVSHNPNSPPPDGDKTGTDDGSLKIVGDD